jgi:NitT/TauT family transport system substrate-binding protein
MVAILQKKGVRLDSVKFVNIGSSADIFKAVVAGTIDAGPGTIDVFQEQARYGVHSLTDGNFWEQLPEYAFQASYATQRAIDTKRDLLVKTLAAYCQLYRIISAPGSKDMFVQARQKTLSKFDAASAAEGAYQWDFFQKYQIFAKDLVLTDRQIAFQQELNVQLGAQERVLPFDQVADMSLAQDALKLIASKT